MPVLCLTLCLWLCVPSLQAQNVYAQTQAQRSITSHIGVYLPLSDRPAAVRGAEFGIGFPLGLTVRGDERLFYDIEIVPIIRSFSAEPMRVDVLIHPALCYDVGTWTTIGVRGAFDTIGSVGFSPFVNKKFPFSPKDGTHTPAGFFFEVLVPVRLFETAPRVLQGAISMAVQLGISF